MSTQIQFEQKTLPQLMTRVSVPARPLAYARARAQGFVEELQQLIRFPSISAQPHHAEDVVQCARWLANHLRTIGMARVQVIPTRRHPLVYAEWMGAARRPTVLIYGHYDVQPAEPLREW